MRGGHHRRRESLAPVGGIHLHRHEARPASVDHTPSDRRRHRALAAHGGEPHGRAASQDLEHMAAGHTGPLVALEPGLVEGARQPDPFDVRVEVGDGCQRADPQVRRHLARPAARRQLGAQLLLRPGRTGRRLHIRGQSPLLVPGTHPVQCVVERQSGVAERQHRVGAPGEAGRGPQLPVAEPFALHRLPGPCRHPGQLVEVRRGTASAGRRRGYHLARDQRRFRDTDTLTGPPCDQQHTRVP